jgi:serine protease Do
VRCCRPIYSKFIYSQTRFTSGVIYKREDGNAFIVTNHHVIDGANQIEVILTNDKTIQAELLGSDPLIDLAVLKV